MLFRLLFQEYTVESFSTETLSSCESIDGPITIYFSLKGEILKVWGFSSFLSEKTRALSVLCARDLLWSKWIGRNTLKIERENWAKKRQNIQIWRGKTKCYGPLCIQTVFFRNSIIDNIDIGKKKFSTVSLFEELKSALARICPKKMD